MILLAGPLPPGGFSARFRILESSREPAGGAIVYLDFAAPEEFLAFHFCPGKELVECFSRGGRKWRRIGLPVHYPVTVGQDHRVEIAVEGDVRRLRLDGRDLLAIRSSGRRGRFGLGSKICPVEFFDLSLLPGGSDAAEAASGTLSWVAS